MTNLLPAGVILAGGHSSRMGGSNKALLKLNGIPLVQHVSMRLRPQVSSLSLSVDRRSACFDELGFEQVEDLLPGRRGPLGGLLAVMERTSPVVAGLLMCPCDAPLLPHDLGGKLMDHREANRASVCAISYESHVQPTFSLWNRSVLPELRKAVMEEGVGGFKQFFQRVDVALLEWPVAPVSPFFNVNTPEDLRTAERILQDTAGVQ